MSEEQRLKISQSKKGKSNGRLGYKHSKETLEKLRLSKLGSKNPMYGNKNGKPHTDKTKLKLSKIKKDLYKKSSHPRQGKKLSLLSREKMRLAKIGKTLSEQTKIKLSEARKGLKHWNWQGGISAENSRIRSSREWKIWRKAVFERDNYTCQECSKTKCYIEPHHIVPIRSDKTNLFNIRNGITLCRQCHQKTIWKESDYEEKYSKIVEAQMSAYFTYRL